MERDTRMRIAAGIVLYNPDIARLKECLNAINGQVEKIYMVDNASENHHELEKFLSNYEKCEIIWNLENCGIARALNQIMQMAEMAQYEWVLTLDDDSVCDDNLVSVLAEYTERPGLGIVCAAAVDDKMSMTQCRKDIFEYVKDCITAGSLTSVLHWKMIGGFDEKMFIDFVDIEYCTRLRKKGYLIGRVNSVYVHQQYGNISGSVSIFGKKLYLFDYSPVRVYYSVRNQIYYMRKHKDSIRMMNSCMFLAGYIVKRIVFENRRRDSLKSVFRGIVDGIKM